MVRTIDDGAALALLADPTRRRLVALILEAPESRALVGRLAETLGLTQPTVSHHVRALAEHGILVGRPEGRRTWYSVSPDRLDAVLDLLGGARSGVDADEVLGRIVDDLVTRFAGTFSRETVERYVRESHDLLAERAHDGRYLSSRSAEFAADRLAALAAVGHAPGGTPEVLFVCVQNAGRSQLAAAILRQLAGDRVVVRTAGSDPADAVRSSIVTVLDEIGVPLGAAFPKPLTDEVVRAADVVVTMGCGDACPVYPGRRYLDWELEDPVGQPLERVREIRDDIERRVRELLASLALS
ncbi:metalloregulator ArsR/SmtB family transcription factor [uncultured Schumannella sp.]|uniref:metalloregulator ArsR/SmtB family transcription factor n=1 Tax=uncultured Schumannella sp. TaxID=1195956 RepID=UPI0025D801F3|nr:metalloregulator ArsR/SmtB family transcription factor [uncultured Schumannella sp.]